MHCELLNLAYKWILGQVGVTLNGFKKGNPDVGSSIQYVVCEALL